MAATVEISETNGTSGSPVVTDGIANINFGSVDSPNLTAASHPIIIGTTSFMKWLRVHLSALGGSTQIANLKVWKSSGNYVTGESIGSNTTTSASAPFVIASYAHSTAGNGAGAITTPYSGDGSAVIDGFAYASALVQTSAPGSSNISIAGAYPGALLAPGYSDYAVFGMATTGSTPAGAVNQKVFTFQYDET